jgi:soluble epoxide hydrolase / lipid-phosphate phosphatase
MRYPITEHVAKTPRHTTFYLASGPADGTPVVFVHGWPELSISWRHQLRCLGDLGFRAIAPDMRGYGRSTVHPRHEDYAIEEIVADMLEMLDSIGAKQAIWVGHDWGTPVVWALASHHPERCLGVAGLCVPYLPAATSMERLIDRKLYPVDVFPAGQWEYMLYYRENFARAGAVFEADPVATVKALFRRGNPEGRGKPAATALVRRDGGWFGGADRAPDLPRDPLLLGDEELHQYASALVANGFFGPDSWYMNDAANAAYGKRSLNDGRLSMPVLFFHAAYDYTCDTLGSRLAGPMREYCEDLSEVTVASGHWMAQERPVEVNAGIARWLAQRFPDRWACGPAA